MKPTLEKRFFAQADLRMVPNADGTEGNTLAGYAIRYNSFSEDLGGFKEVIKPGAFTESLKTADIRALIDHHAHLLLGRTSSGTLKLTDESIGLGFEADLPDVSYARDLKVSVQRRDKDGMSFGFICQESEWSYFPGVDEDGDSDLLLRTIVQAELIEISCVTFPAYTDTTAAVRSLDQAKQDHVLPSRFNRAKQLRSLLDLNARRFA